MTKLVPEVCDVEVTKFEFDYFAREKMFSQGPWYEQPSIEYGAPYIARSEYKLFGQLRDGRRVWAWRYPEERD